MPGAEVVVVGGGASGLAAAAALGRLGREAVVLERHDRIGETWSRRYERLCLHTVRTFSGLPFQGMPRRYPRYVPKALYAEYLADYAESLGLDVRLGTRVERIRLGWAVETDGETWEASAVVVATGRHNEPRLPDWPGREEYGGRLLHSVDYATGREFAGRHVLVIGIGNTGAEVAADLVECGAATVTVSVRSRPPIAAREILGVPVQLLGIALAPFPSRAVDRVGAVIRRVATGDLSRYGLGAEEWGPFTVRRPPVIDVGFLAQLKAGRIAIRPDVAHFTSDGVVFADGTAKEFDAVIAATGFTTALERLVDAPGVLDERGLPRTESASPGLYFAGYSETPRGQLLESKRRAPRLAEAVDSYLAR